VFISYDMIIDFIAGNGNSIMRAHPKDTAIYFTLVTFEKIH